MLTKMDTTKIIKKYVNKLLHIKRLLPCNKTCPIDGEELSVPYFKYVDEKNHVFAFNAEPLARYILHTGDIRNPLTRIKWTSPELLRLDRIIKKRKLLLNTYGLTCWDVGFKINAARKYAVDSQIDVFFGDVMRECVSLITFFISEGLGCDTFYNAHVKYPQEINRLSTFVGFMILFAPDLTITELITTIDEMFLSACKITCSEKICNKQTVLSDSSDISSDEENDEDDNSTIKKYVHQIKNTLNTDYSRRRASCIFISAKEKLYNDVNSNVTASMNDLMQAAFYMMYAQHVMYVIGLQGSNSEEYKRLENLYYSNNNADNNDSENSESDSEEEENEEEENEEEENEEEENEEEENEEEENEEEKNEKNNESEIETKNKETKKEKLIVSTIVVRPNINRRQRRRRRRRCRYTGVFLNSFCGGRSRRRRRRRRR